MEASERRPVVVAGGTGNVGGFIVRELLERGVRVAVPSRSEGSIQKLRDYLSEHVPEEAVERLHTLQGNLNDGADARRLREEIAERAGPPRAVMASLGRTHMVPSVLEAGPKDLEPVLEGFLFAHYNVARTFLPEMKSRGGTYLFINGPLAFDVWGSQTAPISIATSAQHMLFRALAKELDESPAQVVELVSHAYIRDRTTQPSSPLPGEAVGAYAAHLMLDDVEGVHGESIHLRSEEQLEVAGLTGAGT